MKHTWWQKLHAAFLNRSVESVYPVPTPKPPLENGPESDWGNLKPPLYFYGEHELLHLREQSSKPKGLPVEVTSLLIDDVAFMQEEIQRLRTENALLCEIENLLSGTYINDQHLPSGTPN